MAATVTYDKVLALAARLSDDEQKQLVKDVAARRRKHEAWLKRMDKLAAEARRDIRAGKLKPEPAVQALKRLHRLADMES